MAEIDILNLAFFGVSIGDISKTALVLIMVSMGLTLSVSDFAVIAERPKPVLIGLFGQLVLLPLVGFLLATAFDLSPEMAVSLFLIAACPGGATSNFMTYLARGDLALSIVLTALSGIIAIFTLPALVGFALDWFKLSEQGFSLPLLNSIWNIAMLTLLPVLLGMALRRLNRSVSHLLEKILSPLSFLVLLFVMGLIAQEVQPELGSMLKIAWLPTSILNFVMVGLGFLICVIFNLTDRQRTTIPIEIGFQNYTLAVVVAIVLLKNANLTIFPIIYLFTMYISATPIVLLGRSLTASTRGSPYLNRG